MGQSAEEIGLVGRALLVHLSRLVVSRLLCFGERLRQVLARRLLLRSSNPAWSTVSSNFHTVGLQMVIGMNKSGYPLVPPDQHFFRLKGERAERVIQEFAERSFLMDWCYSNPELPNGKELCDLLIVYDDIAIVWSIKELHPFHRSKAKKSLRQLGGASRQLFEMKTPIELRNPRRGCEIFDPKAIRRVFLVSVLMGDQPEVLSFVEEVRKRPVHVLTREAVEILLTELDTVADFAEYLQKKQEFLATKRTITILGGEQELLAVYLAEGRGFGPYADTDRLILTSGHWHRYQTSPEYSRKKEADSISYVWDSIIDQAHEGSEHYERVARELARPNRFERRVLAKAFAGAHMRAHEECVRHGSRDGLHLRRVMPGKDATYCFLFMDDIDPRERRRKALGTICFVARGKFPERRRIVGVATEMQICPTCSYDFCFLDIPDWMDKHQEIYDKISRETGIFVHPEVEYACEDEYPVAEENDDEE